MTGRKDIEIDPYAHDYHQKCFLALKKFSQLIPKYIFSQLREPLKAIVDRVEIEYFSYLFELRSKGLIICRTRSRVDRKCVEDFSATQIKYLRLRRLLERRRAAQAMLAVCIINSRSDYGED